MTWRAPGLVATTSAHGAQSPHKSDWSPLAGKDVVILPDHDAPGENYAKAVVRFWPTNPRPRVKIFRLPISGEPTPDP